MSNFVVKEKSNINILKLILSSVVSVIVSLGLILIFALVIKWFNLGDAVINPVNIVIKLLSIALGVFIATKDGSRGLIKGAIIGVIYIVCCYVIFSSLLGSFSFSLSNVWDILFGAISGAILGIMFVSIKK